MSKIPTPPVHPHSNWATLRCLNLTDLVKVIDLDGVEVIRPVICVSTPGDPHSTISVHGLTGLRLTAGDRIPYNNSPGTRSCWRWPN